MSGSWDAVDYNLPDSSVHGISQVRILEWLAISYSRASSQPRNRTCVSGCSCTAGGFFIPEPSGSPYKDRKRSEKWMSCVAILRPPERGDYVAMVRHQVYQAMTPDTCGRTCSYISITRLSVSSFSTVMVRKIRKCIPSHCSRISSQKFKK